MKGIILAGGRGTRLYPMTLAVSKQLLTVYDKPVIYYPLSVLLLAGIRDILIIATEEGEPRFRKLLGDGSRIGVHIEYAVQKKPRGLAESFIIGEEFIGDDDVCLILGDNVFYGQDLTAKLEEGRKLVDRREADALIFGYMVKNPENFGVLEFDENNRVISVEEKPEHPKSNYIIPGLYFYSNQVIEAAKSVKPSPRGEIEITDVNKWFLEKGRLSCSLFGRGFAWFDTGTPASLLRASEFIASVQTNQGFYVSCPEEIAWRRGFITHERLMELGKELESTEYGNYLLTL